MDRSTELKTKVPPGAEGVILIHYLMNRFRYKDKEAWEKEIREGRVTLNKAPTVPDQPLKARDLICYRVDLKEPEVDRDVRILHREEGFLVALKPAHLPSHADGNFIKNTFVGVLGELLLSQGSKERPRLVHRLDRETSGLMAVALTKEALRALTKQFEEGRVEKEYLALVKGEVAWERTEVGGSVARDPESSITIRRKVVPYGTPDSQPALTLLEKVRSGNGASVLKCFPKTGRTNQIRVHLDSIGHPVVGDKLYGRSDAEFLEFVAFAKEGGDPRKWEKAGAPRLMLHASRLSFKHPMTGAPLTFEAPLPPDMAAFIETYQA